MSQTTVRLEKSYLNKVLEVAQERRPYKKITTYADAVREALDFFIESNIKIDLNRERSKGAI